MKKVFYRLIGFLLAGSMIFSFAGCEKIENDLENLGLSQTEWAGDGFEAKLYGGMESAHGDEFYGITMITSSKELKEYRSNLSSDFMPESLLNQETKALKKYSASYFRKSMLLIIHTSSGYVAYPDGVKSVEFEGDTVKVTLEDSYDGSTVMAVCGFWAYYIQCNKTDDIKKAEYIRED